MSALCNTKSDRNRPGYSRLWQMRRSVDSICQVGEVSGRKINLAPDVVPDSQLVNPDPSNRLGRASENSQKLDPNSIEAKSRVFEAILLISREPLSVRKAAALAGLADPTEARTVARRLNEIYDSQGHSFRIEEVAGGMQLLTRPQFATWLRRFDHIPSEELLSQGMLETLAIIAYRQPLVRAEIEAIRGVNCDEVLRQLMQRDLVKIDGRQEDLGRAYLYGTTRRFLQLFGMQSLDNLPRAQKIRAAEAEIASRISNHTQTPGSPIQNSESPIPVSIKSDDD